MQHLSTQHRTAISYNTQHMEHEHEGPETVRHVTIVTNLAPGFHTHTKSTSQKARCRGVDLQIPLSYKNVDMRAMGFAGSFRSCRAIQGGFLLRAMLDSYLVSDTSSLPSLFRSTGMGS